MPPSVRTGKCSSPKTPRVPAELTWQKRPPNDAGVLVPQRAITEEVVETKPVIDLIALLGPPLEHEVDLGKEPHVGLAIGKEAEVLRPPGPSG